VLIETEFKNISYLFKLAAYLRQIKFDLRQILSFYCVIPVSATRAAIWYGATDCCSK